MCGIDMKCIIIIDSAEGQGVLEHPEHLLAHYRSIARLLEREERQMCKCVLISFPRSGICILGYTGLTDMTFTQNKGGIITVAVLLMYHCDYSAQSKIVVKDS